MPAFALTFAFRSHSDAPQDSLKVGERQISNRIVQSIEMDRINRRHPGDVEKERHVVVVVGITGSGKSSTANTLRGSRFHAFQVSDSISSVTRSAAYKDFNPTGTGALSRIPFRVVDTPGLQDTNRSPQEIETELLKIRALSPHGVSCFIVCVPMGRVTEEHERALKELSVLLGDNFSSHAMLVITNAIDADKKLLYRDQLLAKVAALPSSHYLRRFLELCGWRMVGVENTLEPGRSVSMLRLQQGVIDTLEANGGRRFQWPASISGLRSRDAPPPPQLSSSSSLAKPCEQVIEYRAGKKILRITCELE